MSVDDAQLEESTVLTSTPNVIKLLLARAKEYTRETVEHLILASGLYIVTCLLLYAAFVRWRLLSFRSDVRNPKRVLIVTAHPDDECMFFGPTILNFTRLKDSRVYIMCLTTGRNYGMGSTRKAELYKSCHVLGVNSSCVIVQNHSHIVDDIRKGWPIEIVSQLILKQVEMYDINTLITFDKCGVSRHPNHYSIYFAVAHLSLEKRLPKDCTVYVLETVNFIRKYWLLLDIPISYILSRTRYMVNFADRALIHKAMKQHQSQLVWFRRLYMLFSRYMLINTLQQMDLSDIELDLEIDD